MRENLLQWFGRLMKTKMIVEGKREKNQKRDKWNQVVV